MTRSCRSSFRVFITVIALWLAGAAAQPECAAAERAIAVHSNLLYWLTATPNIGADVALGRHFSLSATVGYNAFNFPNYRGATGFDANPKLHHYLGMVEGRYRVRQPQYQSLRGLYFGLHILGGQYNAGGIRPIRFLRDTRYEGTAYGAGLSVGYNWALGHRWRIGASLGVGYLRLDYTKYDCGSCGRRLYTRSRGLIAPTKLALTFAYVFGERSAGVGTRLIASAPKNQPIDDNITVTENAEIVAPSDADAINRVPTPEVVPSDTIQNSKFPIQNCAATLRLRFPVDRTDLRPSYADNSAVLDSLRALGRILEQSGARVLSVHITGYASPEYTDPHNRALAERRAHTAAEAVRSLLPLTPDTEITIDCGGPDWEGLRSAAPSLTVTPTPSGDNLRRERSALRSVLATLRRAEITVIYLTPSDSSF